MTSDTFNLLADRVSTLAHFSIAEVNAEAKRAIILSNLYTEMLKKATSTIVNRYCWTALAMTEMY